MVRVKLATVCLCALSQLSWSVTILNPGYRAEVFASYDSSSLGQASDFAFGSDGQVYVAHSNYHRTGYGSIQRVTSSGLTALRSDLRDPLHLTYGGGAWGDNFYVADRLESRNYFEMGEITRVGMNGSKSAFASGLNQPASLVLDPSSNGQLYIANSAHDRILRVGTAGGTAAHFSSYPYNVGGSIQDMAFDTTGNYGGGLFTATVASDLSYSGLFAINAAGNAGRFIAGLEQVGAIAFDDTAGQDFNGWMYVSQRLSSEAQYMISGIDDSGNLIDLAFANLATAGYVPPRLHFGPDGNLYVLEWNSLQGTTTITQISVVPEPATLGLLGLGLALLRRRR